jgi:cellulose synthase (UDP-forming)
LFSDGTPLATTLRGTDKAFPMAPINRFTDIRVTQVSLALSAVATGLLVWSTGTIAWSAGLQGHVGKLLEALLFGALAGFLAYGNLCFQVARLGRLKRTPWRRAWGSEAFATILPDPLPALTVLVPSYREEISVICQTLLSAALQDYPNKRIVLLLDDPPQPKTEHDRAALSDGRALPAKLQTLFQEPADHVTDARAAFLHQLSTQAPNLSDECVRLSNCFRWMVDWLDTLAKQSPLESHTDVWFTEQILTRLADQFREQAALWSSKRRQVTYRLANTVLDEIAVAYAQLASRFQVEFEVFERKRYRNLSHEPNKAMNLNSYLGLMGKRVVEEQRADGIYLKETSSLAGGSRLIPNTTYVITLDADSLLLPHYASTLVQLMEQPEHTRTAVAQTPYSAFPNAPGALERTAGATTDIQYLIHQGFTHYNATFWVGANALLRKSALEEICIEDHEGGNSIRRYIQDRTVIEDTESTVDLLARGWSLHNHPERLAYSATPPDFGSLVIQRTRWANGGLIILPKLLALLRRAPKRSGFTTQAMLQIHYLTSLAFAPLSVLLLLVIPFSSELMTPWMPLAALPYFALYLRDLAECGYRPMRDLIRVYALNLLLIPVHLTGALTSMRQAIAGTKIPFRRTPKISGRTRTSGMDLTLQLTIVGLSTALGLYYGSQMRWISGAFALFNAGLLLYGIRQFIGFSAMKEDLVLSARETFEAASTAIANALRHITNRFPIEAPSPMNWGRAILLILLPGKPAPQYILWTIMLATALLSPAKVAGELDRTLNPIQVENSKSGTGSWVLTKPARNGEIEGYASSTSVNRGETIRLYVNTTAQTYNIAIYRMGWYKGLGAREVLAPTRHAGHRQPPPYRDAETGLTECRWGYPIEITIPSGNEEPGDWVSGYYLVKLTAEPTGEDSYILFIVRDDRRTSTYLAQSSVTTFQAYNNWGGKSLYGYNSTGGRAVAVSFNRPYAVSPDANEADSSGAGPFLRGWEYNMVRWLERSGYDVTYTTNLDVHEHADAIQTHRAFLSVGHDEYWTWEMRLRLEEARDRGVHLGFFSANTGYWQIRMEPSRLTGDRNRTLIAYKELAQTDDPVLLDRDPANDHLATTKWRSAPVNRPEASLIGGMYLEGIPEIDGDLVIEAPSHWIVEGTGLKQGAHLHGLLGYEVDGVADSSPPGLTVIARSPVGTTSAVSTVYTAPSGSVVFNAGSMQWIWGLDDYRAHPPDRPRAHPAVQLMTEHVLDRFSREPESRLANGGPIP